MDILSASVTIYHIMPGAMEASRGLKIPQIGIDSCKPPCGCWEWNRDPLQEQPLLTSQPSLQPQGMECLTPRSLNDVARFGNPLIQIIQVTFWPLSSLTSLVPNNPFSYSATQCHSYILEMVTAGISPTGNVSF